MDKVIEIYDDVISDEDADFMEKFVLESDITWVLGYNTAHNTNNIKDKFSDFPFFCHYFVKPHSGEVCSKYFDKVGFLVTQFNLKTKHNYTNLLRAQLNCVFKEPTSLPSPPHIDSQNKHFVLLYYPVASDGNTVFYDDNFNKFKEVEPRKNRFVLFDGSILHGINRPKINDLRFAFNINLQN